MTDRLLGEHPTIIQVANRWVTMEKAKWSPSHHEETVKRLNRNIYPQWGDRLLDEIDPTEVSVWLDELHQNHRGTGVRTIYQAFKTPVTWAITNRLITANPCQGVTVPVDHAEPVVPPDAEAIRRTIFQTKDPMWKALLVLASVTGLRRGELAALQWGDIGADYLTVRRAISGSKAEVKAPKSVRSRRRLAVSPKTISLIEVWSDVQADRMNKLGIDQKPGHYVFTHDRHGLKPMNPGTITAWWLRNRCDPSCRFHDLRHFNVSQLLAAGVDLTTVAARMGHSPDVMLKVYSHMLPERDTNAADIMEDLLSAPWTASERDGLGLAPKDTDEAA